MSRPTLNNPWRMIVNRDAGCFEVTARDAYGHGIGGICEVVDRSVERVGYRLGSGVVMWWIQSVPKDVDSIISGP